MRFRLRALMIVLALGPPLLAALWLAFDLETFGAIGDRQAKRAHLGRVIGE